jgi:hypothetical protein
VICNANTIVFVRKFAAAPCFSAASRVGRENRATRCPISTSPCLLETHSIVELSWIVEDVRYRRRAA